MVEEKHLMEKVHEVLVMAFLEILYFLVLVIVPYLILIIEKNKFFVLCEGLSQGINLSTGSAEKKFSIHFSDFS